MLTFGGAFDQSREAPFGVTSNQPCQQKIRLTKYPEGVILNMEKRRPHYDLKAILAQMTCVESMNLTMSAQQGIRVAGMTRNEALAVITQLSAINFYKSMTTHQSHRVWQDVYRAKWREKLLYVKFQQAEEYFIVSFKEL